MLIVFHFDRIGHIVEFIVCCSSTFSALTLLVGYLPVEKIFLTTFGSNLGEARKCRYTSV